MTTARSPAVAARPSAFGCVGPAAQGCRKGLQGEGCGPVKFKLETFQSSPGLHCTAIRALPIGQTHQLQTAPMQATHRLACRLLLLHFRAA